jgi:hypothetical protein
MGERHFLQWRNLGLRILSKYVILPVTVEPETGQPIKIEIEIKKDLDGK